MERPSKSWKLWRERLDTWARARRKSLAWGLLPSSLDLVVVTAYLAALATPVFGSDVFWHLSAGREILKNGTVPDTNTFSFTAPTYPWIDNEWLAQVILYGAADHLGEQWLLMMRGAFFALAIGLLYLLLRRKGGVLPALGLTFISLAVALPWLRLGPAMVALPFFVALLYILEAPEWRKGRSMVLLPFLFLLWANLHGSFFIGLFLLILHILGSYWDYRKGRGDPMWFYHLIGLLPALLFSLWNPYYSRIYLKGLGKFWETLSTFPLWLTSGSSGLLFLAVVVITAFTSYQVRDAFRGRSLLPLLGLGGFAVIYRDAMAEAVLLAALTIMQNLQLLAFRVRHAPKREWEGRESMHFTLRGLASASKLLSALDRRLTGRTYILLLSALTLLIFIPKPGKVLNLGPGRIAGVGLGERLPPQVTPTLAAAHLMDVAFPKARVLAHVDMAGYLIYSGFPDIRVFLDPRYGAYPGEVIEDYERFAFMELGWERILDYYEVDFVLWPVSDFQPRALSTGGLWRVLFQDTDAVLLGRSIMAPKVAEGEAGAEGEGEADVEGGITLEGETTLGAEVDPEAETTPEVEH